MKKIFLVAMLFVTTSILSGCSYFLTPEQEDWYNKYNNVMDTFSEQGMVYSNEYLENASKTANTAEFLSFNSIEEHKSIDRINKIRTDARMLYEIENKHNTNMIDLIREVELKMEELYTEGALLAKINKKDLEILNIDIKNLKKQRDSISILNTKIYNMISSLSSKLDFLEKNNKSFYLQYGTIIFNDQRKLKQYEEINNKYIDAKKEYEEYSNYLRNERR